MKIIPNQNEVSTKRIIITCSFLSMFVLGTILIFTVPTSVKITYGLNTQTTDGEIISFNIFEPQQNFYEACNGETKKKAIIIGHGVMINKEMMKGYAIELAAAGFIAVPFDFRGHGQSTLGLGSGGLIDDIKAVKEYLLAERDDIDENGFGYIGYSMGGGPGCVIVKEDTSFKCFIGVGTGLPKNAEDTIRADSSRRLNVLMIQARFDEAFSLSRVKEGMAIRLNVNPGEVHVNKLYGSFEDGDASMIYLDDNSNHLAVGWDQDFIREARNWVINTFPVIKQPDENFYANIRVLILILQLVGGIGFFFLIVEPLSNLILKNEKKTHINKIEISDKNTKNISSRTLFYSLLLGIPGIIIFIPILLLLPLAITGFVLALLFGQAFGILILLWRISKKSNSSLLEILKEIFKGPRSSMQKQIALGVILTIILYLILILSIGLNYLAIIPSLGKIIYFPIFIVIGLYIFMIFGLLFNVVIQPKLEEGLIGVFKSGILIFGFLFAYMFTYLFIICIIMGNFFYFGSFVPIAIPLYVLSAFSSAILYQKTGNIITGTIVNASFFILFLCTLSTPQSGYSFIIGILT